VLERQRTSNDLFTASLAHGLRNRLTAIGGLTGTLNNRFDDLEAGTIRDLLAMVDRRHAACGGDGTMLSIPREDEDGVDAGRLALAVDHARAASPTELDSRLHCADDLHISVAAGDSTLSCTTC